MSEAAPLHGLQRALERIAAVATGSAFDGVRAVVISDVVVELFDPVRHLLMLSHAAGCIHLLAGEQGARTSGLLPVGDPLAASIDRRDGPTSRTRLGGEPAAAELRREMDRLGTELLVPLRFATRVTGWLAVGHRRSGTPYTAEDLRLLGLLATHGAIALEQVAARLADLGSGDTVMVGAETRERLTEEFAFEDVGEPYLRNVERPVRAFRIEATGRTAVKPTQRSATIVLRAPGLPRPGRIRVAARPDSALSRPCDGLAPARRAQGKSRRAPGICRYVPPSSVITAPSHIRVPRRAIRP